MKTAWKMFITDAGLNSYQNETLELRDFYRMIVFLQNNFKGRISFQLGKNAVRQQSEYRKKQKSGD